MESIKANSLKFVEELTGLFYKFTKGENYIYVPECDINDIEGFVKGDRLAFIKSYKYNLGGRYSVEYMTGRFYRFTDGTHEVYISEDDMYP